MASAISPTSSFSPSLLTVSLSVQRSSGVSQLKKTKHNPFNSQSFPSSYPIAFLFSKVPHLLRGGFPMLSVLHLPSLFISVSFFPNSRLKLLFSRSLESSIGQIQQTHLGPQLSQPLKSIKQADSNLPEILSTPGCPALSSWSPASFASSASSARTLHFGAFHSSVLNLFLLFPYHCTQSFNFKPADHSQICPFSEYHFPGFGFSFIHVLAYQCHLDISQVF